MSTEYWPDGRVRAVLDQFGLEEDQSITSLTELKREIHQYGKRRCDKEASRDNLVYYIGFAFEANEALSIDSLALTGILSLPWRVFQEVLACNGNEPASLIDALMMAIEKPAIHEWCRKQGTCLQWRRLKAIYRAQVDDFRSSEAFTRTNWRRKNITRPQYYLIGEISRLLDIPAPPLSNRGQAFDYIANHGGNPRFSCEPASPTQFWED